MLTSILLRIVSGKIPYYTMPPSRNQGELLEETKIVSGLGEEFNVDAIYGTEAAYVGNLTSIDNFQPVEVPQNASFLFDEKMLEVNLQSHSQHCCFVF